MTLQRMLMVNRPRTTLGVMLLVPTVIVGAMVLVACSSRAVAVYEPLASVTSPMVARASGIRVGELAESGSLASDAVWATEARSDAFVRFTSESDEPERVVRRLAPTPAEGLVVELRTQRQSAASGKSVLILDESGDVLILSNVANKIESDFEPRAIFMPAELAAGEEVVREIGVKSEGPMFGSGSGKGTSKVAGVGMQTVETPAGVFEAFVVESELDFKVGPARITLGQRAWIDTSGRRVGVVAEEGREIVRVLGLTVHSETRVSLLEEIGVTDFGVTGE